MRPLRPLALLLLLAAPAPLWAADAETDGLSDGGGVGWIVTLGASVFFEPAYLGADEGELGAKPILSVRKADELAKFTTPDQGFGFALYDSGRFQIGPVGNIVGDRDDEDYAELNGLKDLPLTVEVGGFVEFWPLEKLRARAELRHGFIGHHGVVADLFVDWVEKLDRFTVAFGPRASFGDEDFADAYFSVSAAEAARNGRIAAFDADGGTTSVGAAAQVAYDWNEAWRSTVYGRYDRLLGDAADSPITSDLGSPDQFMIGTSLTYSFKLDW